MTDINTGDALSPAEVREKGQQIYNEKLKQILEKDHQDEFVVVCVETGEYFISKSLLEVLQEAKKKCPNKIFHTIKIGSEFVFKVGSYANYLMNIGNSNDPLLKIKVEFYGTEEGQGHSIISEAMVDTGFSGYVYIPTPQAVSLGLVLLSTALFMTSDNLVKNTFLCLGNAKFENKVKPVVFALIKGNIIVGKDFLKAFDAKLELDYKNSTSANK